MTSALGGGPWTLPPLFACSPLPIFSNQPCPVPLLPPPYCLSRRMKPNILPPPFIRFTCHPLTRCSAAATHLQTGGPPPLQKPTAGARDCRKDGDRDRGADRPRIPSGASPSRATPNTKSPSQGPVSPQLPRHQSKLQQTHEDPRLPRGGSGDTLPGGGDQETRGSEVWVAAKPWNEDRPTSEAGKLHSLLGTWPWYSCCHLLHFVCVRCRTYKQMMQTARGPAPRCAC